MKRAETGRPHLFRLIAMIHKTAYILAYDMLRRKGGHDWVERRAGGIIGLPYLSLILVALLTLKDDPNNGQKIVTGILIGWALSQHGASPDFSSNLLIGEWKSEKNLICVLYIGKRR